MRRNRIAARITAAIIAVSMVMTDAIPTLASEAAQTEVNVSVEQDVNGSVSGVSKVTGFDGRPSVNTLSSDDGTVNRKYAYTNWNYTQGSVYLRGKKAEYLDAYSGYYKYSDELFFNGEDLSTTVARLYNRLPWYATVNVGEDASAVTPKMDNAKGFYLAQNGKYYLDYHTRNVREDDAQGNSKVKRITYMVRADEEIVWLGSLNEVVKDKNDILQAAKRLYGKKLAETDADVSYYEANGATYLKAYVRYTELTNATTGETEYKLRGVYAYTKDQITFDSCYHRVYWTPVTNVTEIESNGKPISVGYQVKVNGELVSLDDFVYNGSSIEPMTTEVSYRHPVLRMADEAANYEVRALYYTTDKTVTRDPSTGAEVTTVTKNLVKTGEWSDVYNYAWGGTKQSIPTVSNLSYRQRSIEEAELSWDKVDVASAYRIQRLYTAEPITDFSAVENQWSYTINGITNTSYRVNTSEYGTGTVKDANGKSQTVDYKYAYYRVAAYLTYDSQDFANSSGAYSDVICVPENTVANTPAITGLTVENKTNGTFNLKWKNIDKNAKVRVYYSTDQNVFKTPEYLYELVNAEGIDDKGTETTSDDERVKLVNTFSLKETLAIVKKKVKSVNCSAGTNTISSQEMDIVPGKKYYFVVVTYDDINRKIDRSAFTPYVANVARVSGETRNVSFGYYNDVVTSKVISAKETMEISVPDTKSDKTSISMTFDKWSKKITGFEIYRKSGKKFKKITTTTSNYYVDRSLKKNTVYSYKVRAYYYNPDTKEKVYSNYVNFSAETGTSNHMNLKMEKKSKTSVKLTWTKVSGAKKYEIYRSNISSTGTTVSEGNGYGNGEYILSNQKWERIKTIKKAGTTSYTDKKLKAGMDYVYRVVAYYKSGKKEKMIYAADSISLQMTTPKDVNLALSGKNAKITWDKDAYASKFEVSYKWYHAATDSSDSNWKVITTKKNAYTFKNFGTGDCIYVKVRAYGGKKWSAYSATLYLKGQKNKPVQKVSVKEITEKTANGSRSAVKVSWKSVSGAAYYKVYRSLSPATRYSKERKSYFSPKDDMAYISRESNTDEKYYDVPYYEYKNQEGSVVGTSAIDRARLQLGVTYYYYVAAYDKEGECISQGYQKPASICYKVTPSIKKITAKKGKTIIKINKVEGAKKYVIYRSTKKNSGYKKIATSTKTTYTDKKTKKGKTYYYKVVAVGKNGLKADFESKASKPVKVKAK